MKEIKFIEEVRRKAGKPAKGLKVGIGDDCAVIKYDNERYLLWSTDMLIEGTHFRLGKTPFKKIGKKAVAVNVSDIAAMGGRPAYITVAVGVPDKLKLSSLRAIYDGIREACRDYGIRTVGGDTNRSDRLVVDVSIIGFVEKKRLTRRSGAREKDLILVTGPIRNGKKEHLDFTPRLEEARYLTGRYKVSSMIDVSDGIAPDIGRICLESRVGCRLYKDAIPLSEDLSFDDALYYGESFELLFTMPVKEARKLFTPHQARRKSPRYFVIGEITHKRDGRRLIGAEGRAIPLKMMGFEHLR